MRLTLREKEILEYLKKNPLISQEELALRFGITRSSAAVHISNLMKKGAVMGKGYVFNEQVSIVVIGESCLNINIYERSENTIIDSALGGFTLDTCRIFANFGVNAKVLTIIGNDEVGVSIVDELQTREVDITNLVRHSEKRSCRQVFINDSKSFEEGFSNEDYKALINSKEWVAFNCQWLLVAPLFQQEIAIKVSGKEDEALPYFATCINVRYPGELPDYLADFAVVIVGVEGFEHFDFYCKQAEKMVNGGLRYCLVTDGENRLLAYNPDNIIEFPLMPNQHMGIRTALPSLLAGFVYALSSGYQQRQAIRVAVGAASSN